MVPIGRFGREGEKSPVMMLRKTTPHLGAAALRPVRRRGPFTPLTRRVLAINILALAILVGGLLYLDQYREGLITSEIAGLQSQGRMFAAALGEGAVATGPDDFQWLVPDLARQMIRRLVETTRTRARLFDADGELVADTRNLLGAGGEVFRKELPPPEEIEDNGIFVRIGQRIDAILFSPDDLPLYRESVVQRAEDFDEVMAALRFGEVDSVLRRDGELGMILSVSVPVQRYKQVLGAILLTRSGEDIEEALRSVRFEILILFCIALAVTVLLSTYLAGTITRPIHLLSEAAYKVRRYHDRNVEIPDFTARGDEIGDLSGTLRDMTSALWQRMDAIESFAADVAHEIKNPLTSLRSAVETAVNVQDPEQQRKLLAVILDDVQRINRLISDISDASRLDAELSRASRAPVDVVGILKALAEMRKSAVDGQDGEDEPAKLVVKVEDDGDFRVLGMESRLAQVFRNLINNADSFSPPGGAITCLIGKEKTEEGDFARVAIEDEGPGIPVNKRDAIFERFYSERPKGEKFGTHSGLGLSISLQIIEAHNGTLTADNHHDENGRTLGARFTVRLPCQYKGAWHD